MSPQTSDAVSDIESDQEAYANLGVQMSNYTLLESWNKSTPIPVSDVYCTGIDQLHPVEQVRRDQQTMQREISNS